eukprot:TRINITY_DN2837_c0_g1_i1.p1 TRINITY_DN2837_c0_g1~~TRINITY_DN2837_c0_g1_i1.p1  ORF type:complete len:587 (+),score=109.18 TRINITY_DN2837_c0_g1_i1:197-1957(+)
MVLYSTDSDHISHIMENLHESNNRHLVHDDGYLNISLVPIDKFQLLLFEHRQQALQIYFSKEENVLYRHEDCLKFYLDKSVLRRTIGWEKKRRFKGASVKQKRKGLYKAKKDIIHSIRYVLFATQIMKEGKIVDFSAANEYYYTILNEHNIDNIQITYEDILSNAWEEFLEMGPYYDFYSPVQIEKRTLNILEKCLSEFYPSSFIPQSNNFNLATIDCLYEQSFKDLHRVHFVNYIPDPVYSNLVYFKHYGFDNNYNNPISEECKHGLLVDSQNGKVIAWSLNHCFRSPYYNLEEDSVFVDSIDGVTICMYFYDNKWNLLSPWLPNDNITKIGWKPHLEDDGSAPLGPIFWETFQKLGYKTPNDKEKCYIFRLALKENRYVVNYDNSDIYLIAARDMSDHGYFTDIVPIATCNNWKIPVLYDNIPNLESNPFNIRGVMIFKYGSHECYEVYNKYYVSIKYSNLDGVGPFILDGSLDHKKLFNIIQNNAVELYLHHFPEYTKAVTEWIGKIEAYCNPIQEIYNSLIHLEKVDFAKQVKQIDNTVYIQTMFKMRIGRFYSIKEYFGFLGYKTFRKFIKDMEARDQQSS